MWKLQNIKKDHWEHFIFVGNECVVGRKDASLLITNDPSVSRKHAILVVRHPEENLGNPSKKSSLFLRDEGSKYGTFKNGVKVSAEEELASGDVVKFGQFESEFRVHYIPIVITTSCLDMAAKKKLKKCLHLLGGHLVSEWQPSCTHLVMSEVKVTVKALCCLVSLKPIVVPEYFEELLKKLKSTSTLISPKEFIPPIGESLIDKDKVSFDVTPQRKNMFKDKTFFFLDDKQYKKLHLGIVTGGGKATVISKSSANIESLLTKNTCVIEPVKAQIKDETKDFLKEVISSLQKKKLRLIPEADIGLAVAFASTEIFCNPSYDVVSLILSSENIPSQTLSEREVYAADSLEQSGKPSSAKRFPSIFDSQPANKKQKLEAPDSLNFTSFKAGEAEEISEIPLSAQVKQELDDMFEVTMRAKYDDPEGEVEELPSTSAAVVNQVNNQLKKEVSPKEKSLQRLVVEQNFSVPKENKKQTEPTSKPSKNIKVERNTSIIDCNGFNSYPSTSKNIKVERNASIVNCNGSNSATTSPKRVKVERNTSAVNYNGFNSAAENGVDENLPRNLIKIEYADLIVRAPRSMNVQQVQHSNVKNFKKFKKVYPKKASILPRIIGGHDLIPYDKDAARFDDWDEEVQTTRKPTSVKGAFDWDTQND